MNSVYRKSSAPNQTPAANIRWIATAGLVAVLVVSGCQSRTTHVPCHPVRGEVLLDDQPVAEALVVFHSTGSAPATIAKPLAYTDSAGRFELTTFQSRDGAPLGEYVITVELREENQVGEETVRDGPNLLPDRYADPQSSDLRYTVTAGANDVPPLKLTK